MKRIAKLVRDKVPELIRKQGVIPTVRVLKGDEFKDALLKKLIEESEDLYSAYKKHNLNFDEQLADVLEIIDAIEKEWNINLKELEKIKNLKAELRGKYKKRIFLENVI